MKRDKKSLIGFAILLALIVSFLFGFYGKVILHPNSYLFSSQGDGIKNYYTYAWYIKNNKSLGNFEGMNYPYGENILYTDCHPLPSVLMKATASVFPGISGYSIGILNFFMLLSIAITAILLYLLFRQLRIQYLLSILGAMGITILSPQIFRFGGHYALSYSFFIPLTLYLLVLYENKGKRRGRLFLLSLSILLLYYIHAYLGMISATLVFTYGMVCLAGRWLKERKLSFSQGSGLIWAAVVPVVFFYVFVKYTDMHSGRTTNPWGILEGYADLSTVFLPVYSPLDFIKTALFPKLVQNWEGWSYIGLAAIAGLIFYLLISVISSVRSKKLKLNDAWIDHNMIRNLFIASLIILAFAMFIPFRFHLQKLINYFDIIKQFRAIGRFAWVFYFISNIMLVYMLNVAFHKLVAKKKAVAGYILMVAVPLLLIFEGTGYHKTMASEITKSPNLFDNAQNSSVFRQDIKFLSPQSYQAILPFPFFCIGSGNYGVEPNNRLAELAFLYSYHLKLPLIASFLSHTSIRESKNMMQLLASNFYSKNYQIDLSSKKPFLLLCLNGKTSRAENEYIKKAMPLITHEEYSLYEINPEVFFRNTAFEEMQAFANKKDSLFAKNGFLVSDTSQYFSFTDFAKAGCPISFSGNNGCLTDVQRGYHTLFSVKHTALSLHKKYTVRFWMYNDGENYGQDRLAGWIFFQKHKGSSVEWLDPITSGSSSHEINNKWSMVELSFDHADPEADYDLILKCNDIAEQTFYIDELLFYDNDLLIYRLDANKQNTTLFKNNHRIVMPVGR
jgi:hypothetical protein